MRYYFFLLVSFFFIACSDGVYSSEYKQIDTTLTSFSKEVSLLHADEVLEITEFPEGIKYGNAFSMYCEIPNGVGKGIRIGYGYNCVGAKYLVITDDAIEIWGGYPTGISNHTLFSRYQHGLCLNGFIQLFAEIQNDLKIDFILLTDTGTYQGRFPFGEVNGPLQIRPIGVELLKVRIEVENKTLGEDIWAFGDSYFNIIDSSRVGYQLKQKGITKLMMQGFGGQDATYGYSQLEKALSFATPKYIVWALGMNLPFDAYWLPIYPQLEETCNRLGIELILCTIPVPKSTAPEYAGKQELTDFVRACGYRFIDVYKAVGCDSQGNWYNQGTDSAFQANDNIHTTELGAIAIANQWFYDFPEITKAFEATL